MAEAKVGVKEVYPITMDQRKGAYQRERGVREDL